MQYIKEFFDESKSGYRVVFSYKACFVYFTIYVERYDNSTLKNREEFNLSTFLGKEENTKTIVSKNTENIYKEYALKCLDVFYRDGIFEKISPMEKYYVCIDNSDNSLYENGFLRTVFVEDTMQGLGNRYRVDIPDELLESGINSFIESRQYYEYTIVALWENEKSIQIRDLTDYFYSRNQRYFKELYYDFGDKSLPQFTYELGSKEILL